MQRKRHRMPSLHEGEETEDDFKCRGRESGTGALNTVEGRGRGTGRLKCRKRHRVH